MLQKIEKVLDERVRPQLLLHGGGIRSIGFADGIYRFELLGQCSGCPSAAITTEELIRASLCEALPEVHDAVLVEHIDEDLIAQAKAILGGKRP